MSWLLPDFDKSCWSTICKGFKMLFVSHGFLWNTGWIPYEKKSLCLPTCPAGIYTAQEPAFAIWGRDFAPRELPSLHSWHLKAFLYLYSVWSLFHFVNLHRHPKCPQPFSPWILNQSPFAQQQAVDFVCGNWLGENTRSCRQLCLCTQGEGVIIGFKDASFISLVRDEGEESV